ncbi:MAG TPA: hypothetical protein VFQ85_13605 [Mycobacteriales bacterium]|nr:hypothetical protein [Mycobacteriales bacterium]
MPLAESITLDGGFLVVVLLALLLAVGIWVGAVVAGRSFARAAGRGSTGAYVGWAVAGFLEVAPLLSRGFGTWIGIAGLVALALQAREYQRAKAAGPPAPPSAS